MHRLVHLDLKGAPPKLSYYKQLFPLLKTWEATGILIEYEDMFPYSENLKVLACSEAYSISDIKQIQELAAENDLIVIPLIQTFGHLEFVLKHDDYIGLREDSRYPNAICPSQTKSLDLIKQMIQQMMELHPEAKWIHIGSDEVWHLGLCSHCQEIREAHQENKEDIFLKHISATLNFIKIQFPNLTPIMWDDMLRHIEVKKLQASELGNKVEPMVWHYLPQNFDLPADIWEKYSSVFPNVWIATSFKGATGSSQVLPNIAYHVQNHLTWINIMKSEAYKFKCFRGYALTGWQRYDHYAVLCELFPVGIPSLIACLQTLIHGDFNQVALTNASLMLGLNHLLDVNPFPRPKDVQMDFSFPGSKIFIDVNNLANFVHSFNKLITSEGFLGWFSSYNISKCFGNPLHIQTIFLEGNELLKNFNELRCSLEKEMKEIFFESTTEEWIAVHLNEYIRRLEQIVEDASGLIKIGAKPKCKQP